MVASYSPHRHHGETATLFAHQPTKSPSRHLLRSPSCTSPFAITLSNSVTTRSAARRSTPTKQRSCSSSPASKFPLSVVSSNSMNTGGMTLRSGSSSPRSSPRGRSMQTMSRSGNCFDTSSDSRRSPLKRGDQAMNVDEDGSRGSPVAKRRSLHFNFQPSFHSNKPVFGSPAFGSPSPAHTAPRRSSPKKAPGHIFEKPTFVRSRPQARQQQLDFSSSSDTAASRMRRVASIENMVARESPFNARNAPLPNASVHPHAQRHPLSQTFGAAGEVNQLSSTNWTTPQNSYKTAKPNLLAFHSTGFVPKRGRPLGGDKEHGPQPDTPCKRTTAFPGSAFQTKNIGARIPMGDLGSPHTPVPTGSHVGTSLLNRRDSFTSSESEDPDRSQSSVEYDLPPTPTKKSWGDFDDDSVFTMNKRLRTGDNFSGIRTNPRYGPRTPKDNIVPPDPSSLSISGKIYNPSSKRPPLPLLPVTPARDFSGLDFGQPSSPLFHDASSSPSDGMNLYATFSEVKLIGSGQFSEVYRVTEKPERQLFTPSKSSESGFSSSPAEQVPTSRNVYAVKKAKSRFLGPRDRRERMQEVLILKELGTHDHVVSYVDHWMDDGNFLCIQTEFCENGSLDKFLEQHGTKGRLDEFRVWKTLLELCLGLQYIHESGFMHLDIKPGNVFITFDGSLKIGDFGMAMRCPPEYDLEKEGDRAYIAQEVLDRKPGQPGDIFSLGVCIIEIAGNEALPPYGYEWESLRKGDISVAPILSTSSSGEFVHRDEEGNPIATEVLDSDCEGAASPQKPRPAPAKRQITEAPPARITKTRPRRGSLLHVPRPGHLVDPPLFMQNNGLENIVKRMIAPDPQARPTAKDLLRMDELHWVETRRRSAATIFEGLWGPCDASVQSLAADHELGHSQVSRSQPRFSEEDFEMDM